MELHVESSKMEVDRQSTEMEQQGVLIQEVAQFSPTELEGSSGKLVELTGPPITTVVMVGSWERLEERGTANIPRAS